MADLLTTKQLQEILQVDRTTIYRMADSGRIPGIKVGNQWRFPRQQIEAWLQSQSSTVPLVAAHRSEGDVLSSADAIEFDQLFPLECVQLIQDSFADILGVMILLTDLQGNSITQPSNPCGLFIAAETSPAGQKRCLELWVKLAHEPALSPKFQESHLGLLCARGLIPVGNEIKAMLVLGGIAPAKWPPDEQRMQEIASDLELDIEVLRAHITEAHHLSPAEQAKVLPFVQRIADIFAHIANERHELYSRLQRIAEITQV